MIELLILGLVLFIVGVGATILYDYNKDKIKDLSKIKESFGRPDIPLINKHQQEAFKKALHSTSKKKSVTPKKRSEYKSSSNSKLEAKDFSTQSTLTVNELIAKIEAMKKK